MYLSSAGVVAWLRVPAGARQDADALVMLQDQCRTGGRTDLHTCPEWCAERVQIAEQNVVQTQRLPC
eukprot:1588014-Pleurochrysis_carterae.AAC.1